MKIQSKLSRFTKTTFLVAALAAGLASGLAIGKITEIYTSGDYQSVKTIAYQSQTGVKEIIS